MQLPHVTAAGMLLWAAGSYQSIAAQPVLRTNTSSVTHIISTSEVMTLWRYTNLFIIIIIS